MCGMMRRGSLCADILSVCADILSLCADNGVAVRHPASASATRFSNRGGFHRDLTRESLPSIGTVAIQS
ncbi:hypothetical protein KC19_10G131700 [Ceratodon purpureus]|uniref:Secreted protein n=1 Tax=Ceratodon purpureus TaxID=3225 RepID=A0A8T0GNK7_CERPU|nr:hypothetical protein KC19_10G131700 [Ceratodon purpureus]